MPDDSALPDTNAFDADRHAGVSTVAPDDAPVGRPRRWLSALLGLTVIALVVMQAVPGFGEGSAPAGLDARQGALWHAARDAVRIGAAVLEAQSTHHARGGGWITDPARYDELGMGSDWPDDVVCAGLGARDQSAGDPDTAGYRMVLTGRGKEHWCLHVTDQGFDLESGHMPPWLRHALALDD